MKITEQELQRRKENNKCPFDVIGKEIEDGITVAKINPENLQEKLEKGADIRWEYDCICRCSPNKFFKISRDRIINKRTRILCPWCGEKITNKIQLEKGQKFGHLTIVGSAPSIKGNTYWYCVCDCGNPDIIMRNRQYIIDYPEEKLHCGCQSNREDRIIGNVINGWAILEIFSVEGTKNLRYRCKCTCGCEEEKIIVSFQDNFCKVRSKIEEERFNEAQKEEKIYPVPKNVEDITGLKTGILEVIGYGGIFRGKRYWLTKCKCGTISLKQETPLRNGVVYSCGCIQSKGEAKILDFLNKQEIKYEYQKKFGGCVHIYRLPFDFYILNPLNNTWFLLEFQGRQHFEPVKFSQEMTDEEALENLKKTKENDKIKEAFCKENDIELFKMTYLDLPEIENILAEKLGLNLSDEK